MRRLLFLAFSLSGGAGLIYEAVWGRYLALFVGHAAYAQVLVIATYLGGMALGAFLVGETARRIRAPLLWYAGAEGGLAVLGLAFHPIFQGITGWTYDWLLPTLGTPTLVEVAKWSLAVLLLLPQAILLGTTFPLMSSGVLRGFPKGPGRTLSTLYFTNSFGAAVGVLVGGFYLVGRFGLPGSLAAAAFLNLTAASLAGVVGWVRGREGGVEPVWAPPAEVDAVPGKRVPRSPGLVKLLLTASFLTAVASFAYEIGWIRMLSLVMGSATHSFEVMLSAFILGLALGAYFVRTRADAGMDSLTLLGWVQWFMGLAALGTLPIYVSSFGTMAFLVDVLPATEGGYALFGVARYGIAIAVMLPSTIMAGMTLPLITTLLMESGEGERSIGRVYGVNTLGSVMGVALAGLVALPVLGLKGLIVAGAGLDMLVGVWILFYRRGLGGWTRGRLGPGLALVGAGAACLLVQTGLHMDQRLLLSGVFRYGAIPDSSEPVLFYRDGRTATVGVHVGRALGLVVLSTNGKPDASISLRWIRAQETLLPPRPIFADDEATQSLLALLPMAHVPNAGTVAHIGHGSGLTAHATLASPNIKKAVTIEIEPEMIAASDAFYPANARVFEDPRSSFVINDAKAYFASGRETFDLIISEPSNPWVSGTASLFTTEFYQRIRKYLNPGGLFAQWFHCYEMTDSLVASVLSAVDQSFSHYRGFQVGPGDLLILASADDPLPDPDWRIFQLPAVSRMLAHVPPFTSRFLQALELFDDGAMGPFLEDWEPVNSDFAPYLDLGAEKARFMKDRATGFLELGSRRPLIGPSLAGSRRGFSDTWKEPVLGLESFKALSIGAWLRGVREGRISAEDSPSQDYSDALDRYRAYTRDLDVEEAPEDWLGFMTRVREVEEDLQGGTAGVADTLFYNRLFQFLEGREAPEEVMGVANLLYGMDSWEHERTITGGKVLLQALEKGEGSWVPVPLLRESLVLAFLARGEPQEAREILRRLPPKEEQGDLPVRFRILQGVVERALQPPR